jgi:hypothetical protein
MKCITPDKACSILQDIHAGVCDSHVGAKSLMGKTYRQGSPPWEGPYEVVTVTQPGSYRLQGEDGSEVPNSWNDDQLRPFYM